ncbi:MAG: hypothetical protein E6J34_20775 [Chloroflexi bacterium]|nr:MAG: hypothetical protein E6J34_20775 [Chloroflexota bacterium]
MVLEKPTDVPDLTNRQFKGQFLVGNRQSRIPHVRLVRMNTDWYEQKLVIEAIRTELEKSNCDYQQKGADGVLAEPPRQEAEQFRPYNAEWFQQRSAGSTLVEEVRREAEHPYNTDWLQQKGQFSFPHLQQQGQALSPHLQEKGARASRLRQAGAIRQTIILTARAMKLLIRDRNVAKQ